VVPLLSRDKIKEDQTLHLPSYQHFDKHRLEIVDLENELYEVSKRRDTLFGEYDKISMPRTLKAKQR
jgi:hypothetical protein